MGYVATDTRKRIRLGPISEALRKWIEDGLAKWDRPEGQGLQRTKPLVGTYVAHLLQEMMERGHVTITTAVRLDKDDDAILAAMRHLRRSRPSLYDALLLLAERGQENEQFARAVESVAALVHEVRATPGRGPKVPRPSARAGKG